MDQGAGERDACQHGCYSGEPSGLCGTLMETLRVVRHLQPRRHDRAQTNSSSGHRRFRTVGGRLCTVCCAGLRRSKPRRNRRARSSFAEVSESWMPRPRRRGCLRSWLPGISKRCRGVEEEVSSVRRRSGSMPRGHARRQSMPSALAIGARRGRHTSWVLLHHASIRATSSPVRFRVLPTAPLRCPRFEGGCVMRVLLSVLR